LSQLVRDFAHAISDRFQCPIDEATNLLFEHDVMIFGQKNLQLWRSRAPVSALAQQNSNLDQPLCYVMGDEEQLID
jgi:hypothetical protein